MAKTQAAFSILRPGHMVQLFLQRCSQQDFLGISHDAIRCAQRRKSRTRFYFCNGCAQHCKKSCTVCPGLYLHVGSVYLLIRGIQRDMPVHCKFIASSMQVHQSLRKSCLCLFDGLMPFKRTSSSTTNFRTVRMPYYLKLQQDESI